MQQLVEILKLKLMISERKLEDQIGVKKVPMELFFIIGIVLFFILFSFAYMLITWVHFSYRFEVLGLILGVSLISFALTPLLGGRLGEFLDFKALYFYPIDNKKMFLSSVLSSLMDIVMMPSYAFCWGGVVGLCVLSSFFKLPLYLLFFLFQILFCIAISQQLFLFYQFKLRRTHWYQFIVTFILPVGGVLILFYSYGAIALQAPFIEEFSRPDYPFLSYTYLFPSSAIALALKSIYNSNWLELIMYFILICIQFSVLIFSGSYLVSSIQIGNETNLNQSQTSSKWIKKLRSLIDLFFGETNTLIELIYKDLLLFLREPYVKTMIFIPLFMSGLAWCISYLIFSIKSSLVVLLKDVVEILPSDVGIFESLIISFIELTLYVVQSLPDKQWVLMIWPFYFYGAMLTIATEASVNIFGSERQGINHLFLLPIAKWKILLSKNLSIFIVVFFLSSLVTILAFLFGIVSFHILHSLWFFSITCVFWIFIPGNFISIFFPMKIDSDLSSSLQRDGFGRTLVLLLGRICFGVFGMLVVVPVVATCVLPLIQSQDSYFLPFSSQNIPLIKNTFYLVSNYLFSFVTFMSYAFGAYILSLNLYGHLLKSREDKILRELNRSVM
ncbi:MAG: hypothetical protein COB02_03290 [Candidatus Cloacimonadota bacterium]|nr:MAG: hypothetical protein COB02_03290 [Candidatus Cloacimonadota bacterium]